MSPAVAAAMARLEAMRAARGIAPRPPADAGQLDQGAAAVNAANARLAAMRAAWAQIKSLDQARPAAGGLAIPSSYNAPQCAESGAAGESIAVIAASGPQGRPEGVGAQTPTEDRQSRQEKEHERA